MIVFSTFKEIPILPSFTPTIILLSILLRVNPFTPGKE